jgi:phosphoglycerate dehydrogenase-like enzyme
VADRTNVVVVNAIDEEALKLIRGVSERLAVTDVSELTRAERKGDMTRSEELDGVLLHAEVVYALKLPEGLLERCPNLKWIQAISTGVDRLLDEELVRSPVVVTNMSGIHEVTIAEFVLMLMLMFVKHAPRSFYQQIEGRFRWFPVDELSGKTLGIIGLGRIGREVARVATFFGMRVLATKRSATSADTADNVDLLLPAARLDELLAQSDFVVLALPLTAESRNLIGEAELRAMKSTGHLINISRGGIVDETALTRALEEGWIAGAGMDVFAEEPLSADSPLRHMRNVIFSPHVSGDIEQYDVGAARLFAENLRRYLDDLPLLNVVDKSRGY